MTDELQNKIETILQDRFAHILEDISFRISQVYDLLDRVGTQGVPTGKVYAEDLNIPGRHFITGYTVTANSPSAGSIAWTDLHMVYNGTDTTITNGSTANKYAWWSPTTTPATLQSANAKPNLAVGEVLLFLNNAGTPTVMLSDTNASMPKALADNTVDTGALIDNAVVSNALAPNAVIGTKIANSAISRANIFMPNIIDQAAIGPNAIVANKIADNAINRSNIIMSNMVGTAALQPNAVDATIIAPNAVVANKIADNAISRSNMLMVNVVGTAAIQPNAVTSTEILQGAVGASKLSILRHVLY